MARKRADRRETLAPRLILDSGAVIAMSRGEERVRALVARAVEVGADVVIPAVVVAETVRGSPRDAAVTRIVKAVDAIAWVDESAARTAGQILGRARSNSTVDALVVSAAISMGGGRILTGDVADLRLLSVDHPEVTIHSI